MSPLGSLALGGGSPSQSGDWIQREISGYRDCNWYGHVAKTMTNGIEPMRGGCRPMA